MGKIWFRRLVLYSVIRLTIVVLIMLYGAFPLKLILIWFISYKFIEGCYKSIVFTLEYLLFNSKYNNNKTRSF